MALYLRFISRGVAARSFQNALIWLLGPRAKTRATFAALLVGPNEQLFGLIYQTKADHLRHLANAGVGIVMMPRFF